MPTLYDNFSQVRQYIEQEKPDLTSYVTKTELANCGYLTSVPVKYPTLTGFPIPSGATEVNFRSDGLTIDKSTYNLYPTTISYTNAKSESDRTWIGMGTLKNYVNGRIAEIETSYVTSSDLPIIDESIVPKENNTYTLGDANHLYNTTYSTNFYTRVSNLTGFENNKNYTGIIIRVGGNQKLDINSNDIRPASNGKYNLGTNNAKFGSTYTSNLYLNGTNIEDRFTYLVWTGTAAEYAALSNYTTYQLYLIKNE